MIYLFSDPVAIVVKGFFLLCVSGQVTSSPILASSRVFHLRLLNDCFVKNSRGGLLAKEVLQLRISIPSFVSK